MPNSVNAVKVAFVPSKDNLLFSGVIVSDLDSLVTKRKQWEITDYKKANEGLYSLLASCLDVFAAKFVDADLDNRKTLRSELSNKLRADGIRVQSNTTTLTMFVRFVFGSDRKRAHGYTYVLKAAISHGVTAANLPSWILEQGGVEEIKRKTIVSEKALAKRAELSIAKAEVTAGIEQASLAPLAQIPLSAVTGDYAMLLARPNPNGMVSIVGVLCDVEEAFFNAMLIKMAKQKASSNAESKAMAQEGTDLLATTAANESTQQRLAA
jgi:hypothetical protein